MHHVEGDSRDQWALLPARLDDYVAPDHPVRFIEAFVEGLDMAALGFTNARLGTTGRPPYAPQVLIKLYLWGYLNRVRTSRKLERETERNLEVLWLVRKVRPDYKTIAEFRRKNGAALKKLFKVFVELCKEMEVLGGELVAIDGTKIQANNSKKRYFRKGDLEKRVEALDRQIERYFQAMDQADREEGPPPERQGITPEQVAAMQERLKRYRGYWETMEQNGETQIALTDPESREMKSGQGTQIAYNVQTAVDAKHHLVVAVEVTTEATDRRQLETMAKAAKEALGVEALDVVVDRGYEEADRIKACEDAGIRVHIPEPKSTVPLHPGIPEPAYHEDRFIYDAKQDAYRCPAGKVLTYRGMCTQRDKRMRRYQSRECKTCAVRGHCTQAQRGRTILRWEHEAVLERVRVRSKTHPEIMAKRKCLAEHPFGTVKRGWDQGYFLLRGQPKVMTEACLSFLAYNMRRVLTIFDVPEIIRRMKDKLGALCARVSALCASASLPPSLKHPFPLRTVLQSLFMPSPRICASLTPQKHRRTLFQS